MAVRTKNLANLQAQLDAVFPDRHRPDGWIGDPAHKGRTSGHNPDDTPGSRPAWNDDPDQLAEVRALDVSADLGPGVDPHAVVRHLCQLPRLSTVVRYIIFAGKIYHARANFSPADYDGSNPHDKHIHIEGAWSQAADGNSRFDFHLEEIAMALTDADKRWITDLIERNTDLADDTITLTEDTAEALGRTAGSKVNGATLLQLAVIYAARANRAAVAALEAVRAKPQP